MTDLPKRINVSRIDTSITLLKQHFKEEDISSLISVLEAIVENPKDDALLKQLSEVFNGLEVMQGEVLTYAPYLSIVLSDDPLLNPD